MSGKVLPAEFATWLTNLFATMYPREIPSTFMGNQMSYMKNWRKVSLDDQKLRPRMVQLLSGEEIERFEEAKLLLPKDENTPTALR